MECVGRTLVRKSNLESVVVVSLGDEQEIGRLLRESLCCFVVCFSYCMAGAAGCTPALNHTTYSHPLLKRLCPDHSSDVCTHCNSCCSIPPPLLSSLSLISGFQGLLSHPQRTQVCCYCESVYVFVLLR